MVRIARTRRLHSSRRIGSRKEVKDAEEDCPAYPEAPEGLVAQQSGLIAREKNTKQSAKTKSALDNRFHRTDQALSFRALASREHNRRRF